MKIIKPDDLSPALEMLKNDGLVAFPTDTLYGLGGNAYSSRAVQNVFDCKGRTLGKPLSVCYPSLDQVAKDVEVTEQARRLAEKFLPGPLTMILRKRSNCRLSAFCSNHEGGVGIRIPNNKVILNLLKRLDFPLTATSANKSTELAPRNAQEVCLSLQDYNNDLIVIDDDSCSLGIASTVVDLCGAIPKIIRSGTIDLSRFR